MFKAKQEYKDPKLRKKIVELRKDGKTWKEIMDEIRRIYGFKKISQPTLQRLFNMEIAGSTLKSPKFRDMFNADYDILKNRFTQAIEWVDRLNELYKKLWKKYEDQPELLLKMAPDIRATQREILAQLEFATKQQEKIIVHQKNLIYSPIQILQVVDKQIRAYEKEGIVQVLAPLNSEKQDVEEDTDENFEED